MDGWAPFNFCMCSVLGSCCSFQPRGVLCSTLLFIIFSDLLYNFVWHGALNCCRGMLTIWVWAHGNIWLNKLSKHKHFLVAEDGSRNKKTQTNLTTVTMSTSGAESAHVENKNPDDGGCQKMEIENLRKEKTIKKGLMTNARRALLVGLTKEQKKPRRRKEKNWM